MHFKDGTPAKIGDIIQHDSGAAGILIGGRMGDDFCSSHVVLFKPAKGPGGPGCGPGFVGVLTDQQGNVVERGAVAVEFNSHTQTRECVKIGHVDLGNG